MEEAVCFRSYLPAQFPTHRPVRCPLTSSKLPAFPHSKCRLSTVNMKHFTNTELIDMRYVYGLASGNGRCGVLLYRKRLYLVHGGATKLLAARSGVSETYRFWILHRSGVGYRVIGNSTDARIGRASFACSGP